MTGVLMVAIKRHQNGSMTQPFTKQFVCRIRKADLMSIEKCQKLVSVLSLVMLIAVSMLPMGCSQRSEPPKEQADALSAGSVPVVESANGSAFTEPAPKGVAAPDSAQELSLIHI